MFFKHLSIFFLAFTFLISCETKQQKSKDAVQAEPKVKSDSAFIPAQNDYDWQEGFGLTHDPEKDSIWFKPVQYYLSDDNCSGLAYDFYMGTLRPGDDGTTDELLKLACSDNEKLRPFYRWCLNKTILVQDGALGEHTGIPARRYAEKFPNEFFEYMDIDSTGSKYLDWVNAISYSGYYEHDSFEKKNEVRQRMISTMKKNCKDCSSEMLRRIETFAKDCFN